ncbi:MAG: DUF4446 family protein [Candidatus Moranbacteria bacterium]|jgi:hypothetical protein|nr:DUF4446 family protein [Candidatus Moranbacteria bacterium]MBP9801068.1 DUF4446 family protein [Candidatus Moranbacteria bacterium]
MFQIDSLSGILTIGGFAFASIAFGLTLLMFFKQRTLEQKLFLFFSGKNAKTLETILTEQLKQTRELDREIQELFDAMEKLRTLSFKSLHKYAVLRFNPFKEVGSNQSFSVAFLDGDDSGVVVSSLHTREGTRVYAKPILKGKDSGFPFTEEEKNVILKAASLKTLSS